MKKNVLQVLAGLMALALFSVNGWAHCEIPCGIYDDEMRVKMISEHITTIEKSMNEIVKIEQDQHHNANQLVRWVTNKEDHANQLQEIVTQYFMTQRIKLDTDQYDKKLGLLHQLLIYSMKAKQTTDLENVEKLKSVTDQFKNLYFSGK